MIDQLLTDLENTATRKGLNFGYGYLRDYNENQKKYPLLWILPLNGNIALGDAAPSLAYTVTGLLLLSSGKKQMTPLEKASELLFVDFLNTFNIAFEDYLLENTSFEHVPERLSDAAYGIQFSFTATYQPSLPCV
jgi:hypothetical protein